MIKPSLTNFDGTEKAIHANYIPADAMRASFLTALVAN